MQAYVTSFLIGGILLFAPASSFVINRDPQYTPWPNGRVLYSINPNEYTAQELQLIQQAMQQFSNNMQGCIQFVPASTGTGQPIVQISKSGNAPGQMTTPSPTCFSYPGMVANSNGYGQTMSIQGGANGCMNNVRGVMRLLASLAGLRSEANKPGRDGFVTVNLNNMNPALVQSYSPFNMYDASKVIASQDFDYNSITLSDPTTFSANGGQTLVSRGPQLINSGSLSMKDCQALQIIYPQCRTITCADPYNAGGINPASLQAIGLGSNTFGTNTFGTNTGTVPFSPQFPSNQPFGNTGGILPNTNTGINNGGLFGNGGNALFPGSSGNPLFPNSNGVNTGLFPNTNTNGMNTGLFPNTNTNGILPNTNGNNIFNPSGVLPNTNSNGMFTNPNSLFPSSANNLFPNNNLNNPNGVLNPTNGIGQQPFPTSVFNSNPSGTGLQPLPTGPVSPNLPLNQPGVNPVINPLNPTIPAVNPSNPGLPVVNPSNPNAPFSPTNQNQFPNLFPNNPSSIVSSPSVLPFPNNPSPLNPNMPTNPGNLFPANPGNGGFPSVMPGGGGILNPQTNPNNAEIINNGGDYG